MTKPIFSRENVFAGWPANHGLWQWGSEILVGFIYGRYNYGGMHNVSGDLFFGQLRSLDHGQTWSFERTNIYECIATDALLKYDGNPEEDIFRIRGCYDHGGDYLTPEGCFFASNDRGKRWRGPYRFSGLSFEKAGFENSSRTQVVDGVFYLTRKDVLDWGSDVVIPAEFNGKWIDKPGFKLDVGYRTVMPSIVSCPLGLLMAVRVRGSKAPQRDGIEIFRWDSGWKSLTSFPTGVNNGNPPALFFKDGRLRLYFVNRLSCQLICESTEDLTTWRSEVLHETPHSDAGYCQAFDAEQGVGVIFYQDNGAGRSEIMCTFHD